MEQSMLEAAHSPYGGASIISEIVRRDPKGARKSLEKVGEEVVTLLSRSPCDLADLFEWVDKKTRRILYSSLTLSSISNLARSPGDWRRIMNSVEGN